MNVIFMGTPEFACPGLAALVKSSHNIVAVVTAPDKPAGRGRKLMPSAVKKDAQAYNLPILQPEKLRDKKFIEAITAFQPDIFVVIAFRILPKKLYEIPLQGAINIHASLLPKYRGAAPINYALLNGETETGLTSFFLSRKVDSGAIIDQMRVSIGPNENFTSLYNRLSDLSGDFLLRTLDKVIQSDFQPLKQGDVGACPAPKITTQNCLIDWTKKAEDVHNHIRAFSEKPGAFCFLRQKKVKILATRMCERDSSPDLKPGELLVQNKELLVGTGTRPVRIMKIQPEGKKGMDALAFINGYMSSTGNELTSVRKEVIL